MAVLDYYQDALQKSQANYSQVLGAYGAGQANLNAQLPGISAGYGALTNNVQGLMKQGYDLGLGDIQKQAAQNYSQVTQGLANKGLSNSTIAGNLANQVASQTQREIGGLAYGVGNAAAQRAQEVGLAQLASRMQGLGMQTSLYGQQGSTLAGYHFPVPGGGGGYGGGGQIGGFRGTHSNASDQGLPMGGSFGHGYAPPGASGYSGGAGSSYMPGYNPFQGVPGNPGSTIYPQLANGGYGGDYGLSDETFYQDGYYPMSGGGALGAGYEGDTYYDF